MANEKEVTAKRAKNRENKALYNTDVTYIKCLKDHGRMVKDKVYKVSVSVATVLVDRKLAQEVEPPKKVKKAKK